MLDLIFFILGVAAQSADGGGDRDVVLTEPAPAIVAESEAAETTGETAQMTESAPETAESAQPEAESTAEAAAPETQAEAEGGSWNITSTGDSSWITNAPESSGGGDTSWITNAPSDMGQIETGQDAGGSSLLAGIVSDDQPAAAGVQGFQAEPQVPTGKFTTATEVKPILEATKGSWVAVREFNGQDLIYVTHIWSWRCGLHQMRYSINGAPMKVWPLPPCHEGTNAPNAIIESDGLPYDSYALGEIQTIKVELLLDDMSEASASYIRSDVLMP